MGKIKRYTDRNGFLHLEGVKISRVQVAPYLGKQIDPQNKLGLEPPLKPNDIYGVFRSADELFDEEVMHGFDGMPFRVGHQMLGLSVPKDERKRVKEADDAERDGVFFNVRRSEDEPEFLIADIVVYTKRAMRAMASGVEELSLGYRCFYQPVESYPEPQYYKGVPYYFVQVKIRANHLALVPHGRAGSDVCVHDEAIITDDGDVITCDSLPEEIQIMEKNEEEAKNKLATLLREGTEEQIQDCLDYCDFNAEQKKQIKAMKAGAAKKDEEGNVEQPVGDAKPPIAPKPVAEKPAPTSAPAEGEQKPVEGEAAPAPASAPAPAEGEHAPAPAPAPAPAEGEHAPAPAEGEHAPAPAPKEGEEQPAGDAAPCKHGDHCKPKMYTQDELDEAVKKATNEALIKGRKDGARAQLLATAVEEDATDGKSEGDVARAACKKIPECQFAQDAADDVAIAAIRSNLATRAKAKREMPKPAKKTLVSVDTEDEAIAKKPMSLNSGNFKQFLANH